MTIQITQTWNAYARKKTVFVSEKKPKREKLVQNEIGREKKSSDREKKGKKPAKKKNGQEWSEKEVAVKAMIAQHTAIHAFVTSLKINISRTNEPHF